MSLFGNTSTTGGLFGSTAPKPLFGTTTTSSGGLFGSTATSTPSSLFGATTTSTTGGLFGSTAPTTSSMGLFGPTPAPSGGLFGAPAAKTTAGPVFSFNAPKSTATGGLFGGGTNTFSFSNPAATSKPSLFNFGNTATSTAGGLFGATQPAQSEVPQAQPPYGPTQELSAVVASVTSPVVFGDERDAVVAKLNQIQAAYGRGKGPVAKGHPPVQYTLQNPYCRFKAVCYNRIPSHNNTEGLVGLIVKQSADTVNSKLQEFKDGVNKILGGRATIHVEVEAVKGMGDAESEVVLYVSETGATGLRRRIPATDLANHFRAQTVATQLQNELGVLRVAAKAEVERAQLEEFLSGPPPAGIASLIWEAAKADNPDPNHLVPWPVLGFQQLSARQQSQAAEAKAQVNYANKMSEQLRAVENRRGDLENRLSLLRRCEANLESRMLRILAAEALSLRQGETLSADEEALGSRLEAIHSQLSGPSALKGRLVELLSLGRSQPELLSTPARKPAANLTQPQLSQISDFLEDFQEGLDKLTMAMSKETDDLSTAEDILTSLRKTSR